MSQDNVTTVKGMFAGRFAEGEMLDVKELVEDAEVMEANRGVVAPDALIEFATPDGGFVGGMAGPFQGADGLLAGWREWTAPWEAFSIRIDEWLDLDDGRVLLLAHCSGRLAGSGMEIQTPAGARYTVAGQRVVRIAHFLDQEQARTAAGIG